jgi:hypothetical protein
MSEAVMTAEQMDFFAEGLYRLATVDGVHESEIKVIKEFLNEVGHDAYLKSLGEGEFDESQLPWIFDTTHLRRVFLKTCFVLIKADHEVSDAEKSMITDFANHLGLVDALDELEKSVEGLNLD